MGYSSKINIRLGLQPPPMEDQTLYNSLQGVYNAIHILNAAYGSVSEALRNSSIVTGTAAEDYVEGDLVSPWPDVALHPTEGGKYKGKMIRGAAATYRQERYTETYTTVNGDEKTRVSTTWLQYGLPGATFIVTKDAKAGEEVELVRATGEFTIGDDAPVGAMLLAFPGTRLQSTTSTGVNCELNNTSQIYTSRVPDDLENEFGGPIVIGSIFAKGKAMLSDGGTIVPLQNDFNYPR